MKNDSNDLVHFAEARTPEGMRLYAIGDIHGCLDQLTAMHERIAFEIARDKPDDWRIIHLGDYVDRGPDSNGVLSFLAEARDRDPRNIVLGGNHDVGFLEFLDSPTLHGVFARFGGVGTAASYGVELDFSDPPSMERGHTALLKALPRSHVEFLLSLDFSVEFGDFYFCHAGIKPRVPLNRQDLETLIWIRDEFLDYPHLHPKLIVHGHTPCNEPEVRANRINLDTGCYKTGVLTALAVDGLEKQFIVVSA
jgi:serine/threonine protein phosphatase 1